MYHLGTSFLSDRTLHPYAHGKRGQFYHQGQYLAPHEAMVSQKS